MRVTSSGLLPPMQRCLWLARSGVLVAGRNELEGYGGGGRDKWFLSMLAVAA